jgi:hypothetical protein
VALIVETLSAVNEQIEVRLFVSLIAVVAYACKIFFISIVRMGNRT